MAPKKEKVDKAGVDGSAMILDYLKKQKYENSHHPIKLITAVADRLMGMGSTVGLIHQPPSESYKKLAPLTELRGSPLLADCPVNKAYATKALKEMHERKEIEGRASGKQTVYHAIQDPADDASPESLAAIDKELEILKEDISAGRTREKALKAELTMMNSRVSTPDLRRGVLNLEAERDQILGRLSSMRNSTVQPVSLEEKAHVEKEWKVWKRHMNVRKRICRELWERCTEVLPEDTTKEDLWESLGLEGEL